jgi:hypothetical protein
MSPSFLVRRKIFSTTSWGDNSKAVKALSGKVSSDPDSVNRDSSLNLSVKGLNVLLEDSSRISKSRELVSPRSNLTFSPIVLPDIDMGVKAIVKS